MIQPMRLLVVGTSYRAMSYRTSSGYRLGGWVGEQRKKQDRLSPERKARLEALSGWIWDTISERWETGFSYLCDYVKQNGSTRMLNT